MSQPSPLIFALTGSVVQVSSHDVETALLELAAMGWDAPALARHRAAQARWPHVLPEELKTTVGPAQLAAQLAEVLQRLEGPPVHVTADSRPLNQDEQRLVADVPPHFGKF